MSASSPTQRPQPEPPSPRDAKAEARAAKAYAKALRPWYRKKRYIFSLGAIVLIGIAAAAGGGTDSSDPAETGAPAAPAVSQSEGNPSSEPAPAPAETGGPTAKLPIANGDWRMDSIRVNDDGLGDFEGTARITYTGSNPEGGTNLFTVTVFVGGKDVAVLNGSADSVQPGRAATVQLISTDGFVGGPYKFDFQNDI
jgi:hypothetical protein